MVTPAELDKELTLLLNELLADTDFIKKRKGRLQRKRDVCEQSLSFSFTRDRGLPGSLYSLGISLSFSYPEVNKVTSKFLGEEYNERWDTGAKPFYTVLPDKPQLKFKYCTDKLLSQFAEMISKDFHFYALNFYEKYDTLKKLEAYFDQYPNRDIGEDGFWVVRSGKQGSGRGCCIAAVLCILEKWDELRFFLEETDLLLEEQRERIAEYVLNR